MAGLRNNLLFSLLAMIMNEENVRLTGEFITNQLATLNLADAREQGSNLILCHTLWQIIYYEIRLRLFLRSLSEGGSTILLYDCVHSVRHHCTLQPGPF